MSEKHEWYPHVEVNEDGVVLYFEDWAKDLENKWIHIGLTCEPGKASKLYIDGELQ